eukprot:gene1476-1386_t
MLGEACEQCHADEYEEVCSMPGGDEWKVMEGMEEG